MIFKAHFYVADRDALYGLLAKIAGQVANEQSGSYSESYPFYSGDWSLKPSGEQRYTPDELDDLSTIPFGR
jgi:hypothetical protein